MAAWVDPKSTPQALAAPRRVAAALALALGALVASCSALGPIAEIDDANDASAASLSPEAQQQRQTALRRRPSLPQLRAAYRRPAALPPEAVAQPAVVALGERLFRSTEMAGRRSLACITCHAPEAAWADLKAKPPADNGALMARRSQSLYDIAWQSAFLWDGRQDSIEGVVMGAVASPDIMGLSLDAMVQRLGFNPDFADQFETVYPGIGPTPETVADALAGFMRTIRSPATRLDRWVAGNEGALRPAELRGFQLFNGKANCVACHSGWRFTDDGFRDIGLPDVSDRGRGRIKPGIEALAFAFRTPTLRGVSARPPYMHDGSIKTLEAVIEHYDRGGRQRPSLSPDMFPLGLSAQEKADLVAFMRAL